MPQELNLSGLWWGKQSAKTVENTTPPHRGLQVGGDLNMSRDEGAEDWSDLSKYGGQTQWVNSLIGQGSPAVEFTPSEGASLLWLQHGAETTAAGTNNVWTLGANPASGVFTLTIYDGAQSFVATAVANTTTAAALATTLNAAMVTGGYGGTPILAAGGPLNTTPITLTFNSAASLPTAARPFYLTKSADTTSPAVTVVNTTPGVRLKHTFVPSLTSGFYATFVRRVGGSTLTQRHSFIDCRIGGNVIEGSTANKALRITPTIISLDPFKVLASDPTANLPVGADLKPFLYTEATGTFTFNGVVLQAQSSFTLTLSEDLQPVYGDDAVPYDFAVGNPAATLGITLIFDAVTAAQWNYLAYGTTAPTTGAKPLRQVSSDVTYSAWFKQKDPQGNFTGNEFKLTVPRLHTPIPDAPAPNPGGGNAEVTLAGTILPPGGATNPYTIDVNNGDVAYTV